MQKLTMSVKEMGQHLGISLPKAYELTHIEGFPVIQLGRRKVIPVEGLKRWIEAKSGDCISFTPPKGQYA